MHFKPSIKKKTKNWQPKFLCPESNSFQLKQKQKYSHGKQKLKQFIIRASENTQKESNTEKWKIKTTMKTWKRIPLDY
jgi:hypothetical protein